MRGDIIIRMVAAGIAGMLLLALLPAPGEAQLRVPRSVIASGGTQASGGGVLLRGTIGQPIAGTAKGPAHAGFFGFWYNEGNTVVGVSPAPMAAAASPRIGSLYPNPARNTVTVTVETAPGQHAEILLVDLLGRVRARAEMAATSKDGAALTFPLQGLPPGIYHVMIAGAAVSRGLVIR